jgi:hypothetical protein
MPPQRDPYQNQGFTDMRARLPDRLMQPATIGAPPPRLSQLFASEFSPMQFTGPQEQLTVQPAVMPQPEPVMRPTVMPQPSPQFTPLPYMGGFSLPFDSALPAFDEPPMPLPAAQLPAFGGYEAAIPIPVQQAPVHPAPMFVDPFERAMMRGGFR